MTWCPVADPTSAKRGRLVLFAVLLAIAGPASSSEALPRQQKADRIVIVKSERTLTLMSGGRVAQPSAGTTAKRVPHPSRFLRRVGARMTAPRGPRVITPRGPETKYVPSPH